MTTEEVDFGPGTLALVYNALEKVGISGVLAQDAVTEMQNFGVLFRERLNKTEPQPTVDEMLEVLDVNMPYLREEMEAVFQVYYGTPVYVTVS